MAITKMVGHKRVLKKPYVVSVQHGNRSVYKKSFETLGGARKFYQDKLFRFSPFDGSTDKYVLTITQGKKIIHMVESREKY